MKKYFTLLNLALTIIMFIALRFTDFNQTMSSMWIGPLLSAAENFSWREFALNISMEEVKHFSFLSNEQMFHYNFSETKNLIPYNYLSQGLVFIVLFAKALFFWAGDLEALQYLQYMVHIAIVLFVLTLFDKKHQKILFVIFYAINPIVLYFVNYPFYYFWQVIPSLLFIYWYFNQKTTKNIVFLFSIAFAFIYLTRPTVLPLILLFFIVYICLNSFKRGLLSTLLFTLLINLAPSLHHGPWHTAYVGMGAYENRYNIELSDEDGYKYYKEKTGIDVNSSNIFEDEIKTPYNSTLKERYFQIMREDPLLLVKNALLNIFQSYSIGYKVGNVKIQYASAILGFIIMLLLLYSRQYILFLAIGFAGGAFTPYFPPIGAYMFGSYILIVVGCIGIGDYFLKKKRVFYER